MSGTQRPPTRSNDVCGCGTSRRSHYPPPEFFNRDSWWSPRQSVECAWRMKKPGVDAEPSEARGQETLRSLRGIPSGSRVALILRHAQREEGTAEDSQTTAEDAWQLTPQGRAHARSFGEKIPPFAYLFVTHTRIARTEDTAREIAAGFRESHPDSRVVMEGADPAISLTSFYTRDSALRDHWKQKLGARFYHEWVDGQIPPNALTPAREAVTDLMERFHSKIKRIPESSLLLAVTHDVHVFAVREVLFGDRAKPRPWIGYLDGVLLTWGPDGHLVARWRNEISRGFPRSTHSPVAGPHFA